MILPGENSSAYFLTPPRFYAMGIGDVNIYVITSTSFNGSCGKIRFQFEFIECADVKVEKEKLLKLMAVKELGMPMA